MSPADRSSTTDRGAPAPRAAVIEAFWSVQGEGRHVGAGMAFLRLATCPIRCTYCDTPDSYRAAATFALRFADGEERAEPNPVDADRAARLCRELERAALGPATPAGTVSVTGGEPLVHAAFVAAFAERWRGDGGRVHLETAALDPRAMAAVAPVVDHVSADYKLPGTLQDGDPRAAHLECFEHVLACPTPAAPTLDVKLVLAPRVCDDDVLAAFDALAALDRDQRLLVVLQPVTPFGEVREPMPADRTHALHAAALARGLPVRVLPQVHRQLGVR